MYALLTHPLGTEISWDEMNTTGTVVARNATSLTIRWADSQETIVANDDDDLPEFAGTLGSSSRFRNRWLSDENTWLVRYG